MSLTLYYAPRTRAFTTLWLMEELSEPYVLSSFDIHSGRHKEPDYLSMNPMGKIPLVTNGEVCVSETAAIAMYLADIFPKSHLAPKMDEPSRAAYLKWMCFAGSVIEPAYGEKFFKWTDLPASSVAWGSFDQMLETLIDGVKEGPWLLGETFSAADVVVGNGMIFGQRFGVMPKDGPLGAYAERLTAREAYQRAEEIEAREGARFAKS